MSDYTAAAEMADHLIDTAIDALRRDQQAPRLTFEQWEALFGRIRDAWMRWLPDYVEEMEE